MALFLLLTSSICALIAVCWTVCLCIDCSLLNRNPLRKRGRGGGNGINWNLILVCLSVGRIFICRPADLSVSTCQSLSLRQAHEKMRHWLEFFFAKVPQQLEYITRFTKLRIILVSPYILFRVMVLLLPNIIVSNSSTILEPHIGF